MGNWLSGYNSIAISTTCSWFDFLCDSDDLRTKRSTAAQKKRLSIKGGTRITKKNKKTY